MDFSVPEWNVEDFSSNIQVPLFACFLHISKYSSTKSQQLQLHAKVSQNSIWLRFFRFRRTLEGCQKSLYARILGLSRVTTRENNKFVAASSVVDKTNLGADTMTRRKYYEQLFCRYPNVVTLLEFRAMLGGIGDGTARKLMRENHVKHYYIRNTYYIPKAWVIDYVLSKHYAQYKTHLKSQV